MNSAIENVGCSLGVSLPSIPSSSERREPCQREESKRPARIAAGDTQALNRVVEANLGLVVTIARAFQGRGLALDDLIGEGNLGLIRAAKDYDPRFGTRFGTYAGYWIRQAIQQSLMKTKSAIRVPVHTIRLMIKWRRARKTLSHQLSRTPEFEEVSAHLGLSELQRSLIHKALQAGRMQVEGDLGEEDGNCLLAEVGDPHDKCDALLEAEEERTVLHCRMEKLDERERAVVALHYGLDGEELSFREIGCRLGICAEWARRLEARAIDKLRQVDRMENLDLCN